MDTRPTAALAPSNEPIECESTVAASALPAQSKLLVCHLWPIEHLLQRGVRTELFASVAPTTLPTRMALKITDSTFQILGFS